MLHIYDLDTATQAPILMGQPGATRARLATLFLVAPSSGPQAPLQTSTFSSEPGPSFCSRQVH